jgi:hypothetical protein
MFQTFVGRFAGRGQCRLPPPRDRPGHLHQLQERDRHDPGEDPVRHRPDRQGLPQRVNPGTSPSAPASSSRWRSSSSAPNESQTWYEYWRDVRLRWYAVLGIKSDKLRHARARPSDELAHYSSRGCIDIEYLFPFSDDPGYRNSRASPTAAATTSRPTASTFQGQGDGVLRDRGRTNERFVPHVIEPSAGLVDRFALATITEALRRRRNRASPEFMNFHPRLAPIKAAVFPLVNKDGMPEVAGPSSTRDQEALPVQTT